MLDAVEAALNSVRMVPCPGCGERALLEPSGPSPTTLACARCGGRFDALAEILVLGDAERLRGTCCAGWRRHRLRWREPGGGPEHVVEFETWAQDHLLLGRGDVVSLLFSEGDLSRPRRRRDRLMPLMAANHTRRRAWALVGSAPVATLR